MCSLSLPLSNISRRTHTHTHTTKHLKKQNAVTLDIKVEAGGDPNAVQEVGTEFQDMGQNVAQLCTTFPILCQAVVTSTGGSVQGTQSTICAPGQSSCGGNVCATLGTDVNHCGSCDFVCPPSTDGSTVLCDAGKCSSSCPAGTLACGGKCTDVAIDLLSCGKCGNACGTKPEGGDMTCRAGQCTATCAAEGATLCDGNVCRLLSSDPASCGACGNTCVAPTGATASCVAGACVLACPAGFKASANGKACEGGCCLGVL